MPGIGNFGTPFGFGGPQNFGTPILPPLPNFNSTPAQKNCSGGVEKKKSESKGKSKKRPNNKAGKKQVDAAGKKKGMSPEERQGFGDFIEDTKKGQGRGPADNFSWGDLLDLADQFLDEVRGL